MNAAEGIFYVATVVALALVTIAVTRTSHK